LGVAFEQAGQARNGIRAVKLNVCAAGFQGRTMAELEEPGGQGVNVIGVNSPKTPQPEDRPLSRFALTP
jgi:hypothetical protein